MVDVILTAKLEVDDSEVEKKIQKPLQKAVSEYEKGINNANSQAVNNQSSTFSKTNPTTTFNEPSTFNQKIVDKVAVPLSLGLITGIFGSAIGSLLGPPGAAIGFVGGAAVGATVSTAIQYAFDNASQGGNEIPPNFKALINNPDLQQQSKIAKIWAGNLGEVNETAGKVNETVKNLNETTGETGEKFSIADEKLKQTDSTITSIGDKTVGVKDKLQGLSGELSNQVEIQEHVKQSVDGVNATMENTGISVDQATESAKRAGEAFGGVGDNAEELKNNLDGVGEKTEKANETLGNLEGTTKDVTESTKNLSQEGLQDVTDRAGQARESLDTMGTSVEGVNDAAKMAADGGITEFTEKVEDLNQSGGFFEGIKQGFEDFVENVESNSELMADFFANTLSQMSQSFSDLFFNVLTGRFDNLKDLAKQTFEAILRAFLDMVAAIATRQIVISVAGVLGFSTGKSTAQDVIKSAQSAKSVVDAAGNSFPATESGDFAPTELDPDTALPAKGSGIGAGVGAGLLGIGIGSAIGGIINSDMTGWQQGISFGLGAAGAVTGFLIGGPVGAAIGGVIGSLIVPIISGLFKKTPRLDIDFDSIKTEVGRRAALVEEFLDPEFFMENIGQVSVKRGGVGVGAGGSNQILELIRERIEETIEGIQDIIAKLPTDLFNQLNETLLNADIDIDTVIAGERLLEFDAKGKKIAEKFQAFIEGELPAKFFASIRESFFDPAFQALGVSAEGTQALIDDFMAKMEAAGSREARAEVGAEFIATFGAFVDAFNIVSGNVNDSIGQTIQSVNNLSAKLGFDAVPSIDELRKTLGEMIENAEIDAETVQAYADLRNAIVSLMSEITSAITGLIGKINQLNTTIVSLGGSAVDTTGFLNTAATQLQDFLGANMGNLSLSEQEGFLDQLLGIANDMLAQEQAAFEQAQQAAREAAERAAEAERAAVQQRIDGLNAEKERIEETFNARIEALNEELRIAEGFAQLTESIRQTLDSILYSPESVLTGIEQVNALQGNVAALQQELAGTTDPERQMEIAGRLEEAFKTLFGAAGDAFGVNSPEYVAIFDQVTDGLSGLAEMTESRARTVEEINAEIERLTAEQNSRLESIDAKIEAAQEQLSAIGTQEVEATFQASDRVKELFEYIRTEYMRILEERFAQLEEASITGFATELEGLQAIAGISEESLVTLKEQMAEAVTQTGVLTKIADAFGSLSEFNSGTGGLRDFGRGTLAVLHGTEAVVTEAQVRAMKKHMALAAEMTGGLGGALGGALETFAESLEGAGPLGRLGRELVGAGRLTELADRIGTARITSMMEEFTGANAGAGGLVERLAEKLGGEDGHISGLARRAALEETKNEMSVAISVNVNGGSGATVASIGNEIENMLVRSIKQGGKLRSAIQDAGAKRMG